ncbi:actin cytoskeleton-regulatory complex protein PAN1-like [Belonocnema kinseyi]|uniref:actin cytoskeleton-regulatory complex protein PAN1-like n=1 Tax=Belonocnema kinseyi TaxID=2817044 RepID=UPI00143DADBE|nr:actin cytoskeleton-regulatory complex protein PAN1-like [Belonocnema kinseyi]
MQLAASQRPHPPPVPPRPSRQVVAEALKRSPRPPCPTRQAPPPPNTKPWRSGEQEVAAKTVGRTVVYESGKDVGEEKERVEENEEKEKIVEPKVEGESKPVARSDSRRQNQKEPKVEEVKPNSKIQVTKQLKVEKESKLLTKLISEERPKDSDSNTKLQKKEIESKFVKESKFLTRSDSATKKSEVQSFPEIEAPRQIRRASVESNLKKELKPLTRSDSGSKKSEVQSYPDIEAPRQARRASVESNFRKESKALTRSNSGTEDSERKGFYPELETQRQSRRPSVESLLENEIYELVEECRLKNLEKHGQGAKEIRLGDIHLDPTRPRLRSQKMSFESRERARSKKDEVDGPQVPDSEKLKPLKGPKPQVRRNLRPPVPTRNNIVPSAEMRESKAGKLKFDEGARVAGRPTLPLKPRPRLDSSSSTGGMTNDGTGNENKSISSDDGATVVIVDESERKAVAFNDDGDNIHHQDWLEAGVRYSSTQITLSGDEASDRVNGFDHLEDEVEFGDLDFSSILERIAMSSFQGLPPLPRSLSGFNLNSGRGEAGEPPPPPTRSSSKTPRNAKTPTNLSQSGSRPSPPARQLTTLDTQLAILRREMFGLRQLDLSLLSQLWSLNESIQEFRQLLQDQEDRAPSPSPSSEEGDDTSYGAHPPPPPRRPAPTLHHHRPSKPPRPPKPPPSDDSPSSEEYGAV